MSDIATKLTTIAENQQRVYDAGYAAGQSAGGNTEEAYQQGVSDGKQAERDVFWESYLKPVPGGLGLSYLFAGPGWKDSTFNPPRGTVITSANRSGTTATQMFGCCCITDLKAICEEREVTLDFSATTAFYQTFCDCRLTVIPTINTKSASSLNNMFWNPSQLETVEKLILKDDGSQTCAKMFQGVRTLLNIVIEGKFGDSVDVSAATKLSKESIKSFVNALAENKSGQTLTLSKTAVNKAFETSEGATDGETSDAWKTLIAPKIAPNGGWNISLV